MGGAGMRQGLVVVLVLVLVVVMLVVVVVVVVVLGDVSRGERRFDRRGTGAGETPRPEAPDRSSRCCGWPAGGGCWKR